MSLSPYATLLRPLFYELQNAFANLLNRRSGDFLNDDVLPDERYAILRYEGYDRNPDRNQLADVRVGINSRIFKFIAVIRIGLDCAGKSEVEAMTDTDIAAAMECLNLENAIAEMKQQVNDYGFIEDIEVALPIDTYGASQRLRDPDTWIANITADVKVTCYIRRDEHGRHLMPLQR